MENDREGQNRTLRKKDQNQTLDNRKLTTFEAILHEIGQIWPISGASKKKLVELGQNDQNLLKIYPWLRSLSQN